MRKFVQKYEVWIFLSLIIVGQMIFMYSVANEILPSSVYSMGRLYLLIAILAVVVIYSRGVDGLIELVKPLTNFNFPKIWLLLALIWAPAVALAVLLVKAAFVEEGLSILRADFGLMSQPRMIFAVLTASLVGEIVWVSYSIGRLSKKFSPFLASQIVAGFWAIWWVPIAIYGKGIVPDVPMFALTVNMMGVAAICAFFYFKTHSAFCVLVLQSVFNSTILVLPVIPTNGGVETYTAFTITYFSVAVVMFMVFGPRPLFDRRTEEAYA